jgi:hypothetical protein
MVVSVHMVSRHVVIGFKEDRGGFKTKATPALAIGRLVVKDFRPALEVWMAAILPCSHIRSRGQSVRNRKGRTGFSVISCVRPHRILRLLVLM